LFCFRHLDLAFNARSRRKR